MKHGDKVKKLSRNTSHRRALMRNMATSLFKYERIVTTVQKAKVLSSYSEKIITKAKNSIIESELILSEGKDSKEINENNSKVVIMNSKRFINRNIKDKGIIDKLFKDIALRYKTRKGGYTRIIKLGSRSSDGAERAIIELVLE